MLLSWVEGGNCEIMKQKKRTMEKKKKKKKRDIEDNSGNEFQYN